MPNNDTIICPNCGQSIQVGEAVKDQAKRELEREYNKKIDEKAKEFNQKRKELEKEREKLKLQEQNQEKIIQEHLKEEKRKIQQAAEKKLQTIYQEKIAFLENENQKNKKENQNLRQKELELLKKETELKDKAAQLELDFQKKFAQERDKIAEMIRKQEEEKNKLKLKDFDEELQRLHKKSEKQAQENLELRKKELELIKKEDELKDKSRKLELEIEKKYLLEKGKLILRTQEEEQKKADLRRKELEKQLNDQKILIAEMKRKAEQGSMQMQGEVQELALEELLKQKFPFDVISEVPKGITGADIIQTVINRFQQNCGKIIYESKRTKAFNENWIEKLKTDQRSQQADIAVLVTTVLPKNHTHFFNKDGVWICNYTEFISLVTVLREMLDKVHFIRIAQTNQADKMSFLYQYLTGNEFNQQIQAIVEGFTSLKNDLDKEKRSMQRIWKTREKQIEKVLLNTIDMYGSVRGIAGNAVRKIDILELPEVESDDE